MMNFASTRPCTFRAQSTLGQPRPLPKMMNMGRMLYCTHSFPIYCMTVDEDSSIKMMQKTDADKCDQE